MHKPDIKILAISNVYCRLMYFKKVGDVEQGHCHTYDHGTLLSTGKVLVEMLEDDGQTVLNAKTFTAPSFIFVNKNRMHRITALEDNSVACCIHALRDINEDIIPSDFLVEEMELADSPEQITPERPAIGRVMRERGYQYGNLAISPELRDRRNAKKK